MYEMGVHLGNILHTHDMINEIGPLSGENIKNLPVN